MVSENSSVWRKKTICSSSPFLWVSLTIANVKLLCIVPESTAKLAPGMTCHRIAARGKHVVMTIEGCKIVLTASRSGNLVT